MIGFQNTQGTVEVSQKYFAELISKATSECFGVSQMIDSPYRGIQNYVSRKKFFNNGVNVHTADGKLVVDLHIAVTYGVNIAAIVKSIVHKVRYTVEDNTGFEVGKVNVFIDAMTPAL